MTPDGYPHAFADDGESVAPPYAPREKHHVVIVPLQYFHTHCENEIKQLAKLGRFTPNEALVYGIRFTQLSDYGAAIARVRQCLIERWKMQPSQPAVMDFLDALCNLHGAFHDTFRALHQRPYGTFELLRLMGYQGIAIRIYP